MASAHRGPLLHGDALHSPAGLDEDVGALVRVDLDAMTGERYNPGFAAMARSCGVEGVRVDRAADLGEAIRKGIAANKPYLIDVDIAADVNPSGAGVWELPGLGQSKPGIGTRFQP